MKQTEVIQELRKANVHLLRVDGAFYCEQAVSQGLRFDTIFADPPWGINHGKERRTYNRRSEKVTGGYVEVDALQYARFTRKWLRSAVRALKPGGSLWVLTAWQQLGDVLNVAREELELVPVSHVVWKYQFGVYTKRRFVTSHAHLLLYEKDEGDGARRYFDRFALHGEQERTEDGRSAHYRDIEDVWTIKRPYKPNEERYPTELPEELVDRCLAITTPPGGDVLDPFCGSGTAGVVCMKRGFCYTGIDVNPKAIRLAGRRILEAR